MADAGWFGRLCERLIMDYPYPYESFDDQYLKRELNRFQIKIKWDKMSADDQRLFEALKAEINLRDQVRENRAVVD